MNATIIFGTQHHISYPLNVAMSKLFVHKDGHSIFCFKITGLLACDNADEVMLVVLYPSLNIIRILISGRMR
jgi:hypothetical protein